MADAHSTRKSKFASFIAMLLAAELAGVLLLSPLLPLLKRLPVVEVLITAVFASSLTAAAAWWGSARLVARMARSAEAMLQTRITVLQNASPLGIIGTDAERRITLFSEGAEGIFGFAASEVMGLDLSVLLPEPYRDLYAAHATLHAGDAADAGARFAIRWPRTIS